MSRWNIILAAAEEQRAAAGAPGGLAERICAGWPGGTAPSFQHTALDGVSAERVRAADGIVVLITADTSSGELLTLLAAAEGVGVPVLVLLEPQAAAEEALRFGDALSLPVDAPVEIICATLRGLMHRQRVIRQLARDLDLAQRCHGGLEGEISRMHEEMQLAAMVQRELLPRELPALHGVSFAAMWRPTNYVSGDIYDVMRLDEDHVGVFIADAVGHGVPAALMTMVISRSLATKEIAGSSYRIIPPAEVLARLNEALIGRQEKGTRFATAAYALVDCRRRTCRMSTAGHPPPLRLRPGRSMELLEVGGGLLGIFPDERYDEIAFDLEIDERVLFHSDGFEQAFPHAGADPYHSRLPTTRYRQEFEQLSSLRRPGEVIAEVRRRLDAQRGSLHQNDDLTLICMHAGEAADTAKGQQISTSTVLHGHRTAPVASTE